MPSSPQTGRTAFTLVELVITIAAVLILASLLLAGGKVAYEKVYAAKCQSNLRQIGLGVMAYAAENNGSIVPSRIGSGANFYWPYLLAPYLGLPQAGTTPAGSVLTTPYTCPVVKADSQGNTRYPLGVYGVRYAPNTHIAEATDLVTSPPNAVSRSVRLQQIKPSKTMIFIDSFTGGGLGFASTIASTYPHGGNANVLFVDGHVESRNAADLERLKQFPFHVFWRGYDWGYGGYRED